MRQLLSDRELLALVLRSGTRTVSALDLAESLLAEHQSLAALSKAHAEELATSSGIGIAKATALVAAFQLGRRTGQAGISSVLRESDDLARVARRELDGLRRERVLVIVCDAANRVQPTVFVSEGSVDRSLVPIREILNAVLRHDGRAFAIAHNHPGGNPEASRADKQATADIQAAARVVGLRFLGHLIVADDRWRLVAR